MQLTRENSRSIQEFNETIKENTKRIEQLASDFFNNGNELRTTYDLIAKNIIKINRNNRTVSFDKSQLIRKIFFSNYQKKVKPKGNYSKLMF